MPAVGGYGFEACDDHSFSSFISLKSHLTGFVRVWSCNLLQ